MDTDDRFAAAWRAADDLEDAARRLGISKSAASSKASRLRAAGVELPRFRAGRRAGALELPVVLQVDRWEWVRLKGGTVEHRRRAGQPSTLCARDVPPTAEVVGRGLRPCPRCWPVAEHPPSRGPLPRDPLGVVVLTGPTSAILSMRAEPGSELRDVETDEVVPLDLDNLGWWTL